MKLRRWGAYVVYDQDGVPIPQRDRLLRRCFSRSGARRYAEQVVYSPGVTAKSMETMLSGPAVFANPQARDLRTGEVVWGEPI